MLRIILLLVILLPSVSFAKKDISDSTKTEIIKDFGIWLEVYNKRCGALSIDDLRCEKDRSISRDAKIIQEFGRWMESCRHTEIGEDSNKKFQECLEIKTFLK